MLGSTVRRSTSGSARARCRAPTLPVAPLPSLLPRRPQSVASCLLLARLLGPGLRPGTRSEGDDEVRVEVGHFGEAEPMRVRDDAPCIEPRLVPLEYVSCGPSASHYCLRICAGIGHGMTVSRSKNTPYNNSLRVSTWGWLNPVESLAVVRHSPNRFGWGVRRLRSLGGNTVKHLRRGGGSGLE